MTGMGICSQVEAPIRDDSPMPSHAIGASTCDRRWHGNGAAKRRLVARSISF